jgi:serine/threonine protein kinase
MPSTTGLRRRLPPALLAGAPYRIGDRMAERFLVKDAVGIGPLGYVFRAEDQQQGIDVAVKMIHPRFVQTAEERAAFTEAVEPARKFLQPSLARVHEIGVDQGWPYLTYSFLDGLTLRRMIDSRLAKGQTFGLEEVEPFLGQLAAALEAAHPLGAHGNLKPENVVILPDMLRVTDWGVARGLPRLPFVQALRQKSAHRYLAPEVASGGEVDPRADLYALGVLVGEMLTGLTPEDDIPELRLTAPELPEGVEGFYRRALNERPEARFRSVRELYETFLELIPASRPVATAAAPASEAPAPAAVPLAAAALPRFDASAAESPAPRHTREVVALEPAAWTAPPSEAPAPPSEPSGAEAHGENGARWRALQLWDREQGAPAEGRPPSASPETPQSWSDAAGLDAGTSDADRARAQAAAEDAELLAAVDQALDARTVDGPEVATVAGDEPHDEPLLEDALGVDLVIDGDEPVARAAAEGTEGELVSDPEPAVAPEPVVPPPVPTAHPASPPEPLVPWASGPRSLPYRRVDAPVSVTPRDVPVLQPRSEGIGAAPARTLRPEAEPRTTPRPAAAPPVLSALPRPPAIPPLPPLASRPPPAPADAPTPQGTPAEPSPTRRETVVSPPAERARGAGSWSPGRLLAEVVKEVQAEERRAGDPVEPTWEPVPLDATQPVSSEEVAARLAAAGATDLPIGVAATPPPLAAGRHPTGPLSTSRVEDVDIGALQHRAGKAGMRLALLVAAGLVLGIGGGYVAVKLLPERAPRAERLPDVPAGASTAVRN